MALQNITPLGYLVADSVMKLISPLLSYEISVFHPKGFHNVCHKTLMNSLSIKATCSEPCQV